MRNTTKLFGIIAIVVVIGLSFASCGDNGGGGGGGLTAGLYRGELPNLIAEDRVDTVPANDVAAAVAHVNANPGTFTLLVGAPVTHDGDAWTLAADVHLTVAGTGGRQTITRTGTGNLFNINDANRSLTLGNNITLAGNAGNTLPLVNVAAGGSLTMNARAEITRNTVSTGNSGGGVNVTGEDSTFTMNGGEIFGNTITGATSAGGVRVADGALFVMHPGAVIRDNTAAGNNSGGGVAMVTSTSIFRMLGGEIRGNNATGAGTTGGGVRITVGTFQVVNGVIYGTGANANDGVTYNALLIAAGSTATLGTMVGGNFTPGAVTLYSTDNTVRVVNGVRQ